MKVSNLFKLLNKLSTTPLHPQWLANRVHHKHKADLERFHNKTVLDIGSGNCNINDFLAGDNEVVRLDYPSTSCQYTLQPDIYGDARKLPFKDNSFDLILLFEVLEHIDSPSDALSEIHRVLKKGGLLLASVPFCYPLHDVPNDYWRFSKYGIQRLLHEEGLTCSLVEETANPFVTIIQLINLIILLTIKTVEEKNRLVSLFLAFFAYPICLVNNIIALPFLLIKWKGPFSLGYFVEAVALKNDCSDE